MIEKDIIEKIKFLKKYKTETDNLEVKLAEKDYPKKCYDTISSFANKNGGIIIFGIDESNDFKIVGVYDSNDLQKQITALCSLSMEPVIRPEFLNIEYEGKKLLAVKISELSQNMKPCYYKPRGLNKGSYIRIGDSDEVMTDYEIYSFESYKEGLKEDLRINKRASFDDLDKELLSKYINNVKQEKINFARNSDEKILKLSGIIDIVDDKIYPTLAGTMIFGEYPQAFYPQLFVACVVVPGKKLGDVGDLGQRFNDNKRVEGTIEQMLEGTLAFLIKNMKKKVIINNKTGKREDMYEYPILALREAVANALIHRDYSLQTENSYIEVYMYDDRIVIQNKGGLYGSNKINNLGTDKIMETRNSTIVRILEEKDSVIENRHSGIPTMRNEMLKYDLPEPEFIEERGSFKVIFKNNYYTSDTVSDIVSDTVSKFKLNEETLINYCKEARSAKEIREFLNIKSKRYVNYNVLKPLIDSGKLEYTNKVHKNVPNQKYISK